MGDVFIHGCVHANQWEAGKERRAELFCSISITWTYAIRIFIANIQENRTLNYSMSADCELWCLWHRILSMRRRAHSDRSVRKWFYSRFCQFNFYILLVVRRMLEFPNGKIQFDSHLISPLKPTRLQWIRTAVGSETTIGMWQMPTWITVLHLMHSSDFKLISAAVCCAAFFIVEHIIRVNPDNLLVSSKSKVAEQRDRYSVLTTQPAYGFFTQRGHSAAWPSEWPQK